MMDGTHFGKPMGEARMWSSKIGIVRFLITKVAVYNCFIAEAYSENPVKRFLAVNYFRKTCNLRCLIGFWMGLYTTVSNNSIYLSGKHLLWSPSFSSVRPGLHQKQDPIASIFLRSFMWKFLKSSKLYFIEYLRTTAAEVAVQFGEIWTSESSVFHWKYILLTMYIYLIIISFKWVTDLTI